MVFLSPPCAHETDLTKTAEELLDELEILARRVGLSSLDDSQLAAVIAN